MELELCDDCQCTLEPSQIGKCDDCQPRERVDVLHEKLRGYFDNFVKDDCDFDYWVGEMACDTSQTCHSAAAEYAELAWGEP